MNLNIKVYVQNIYFSGVPYFLITYQSVDYYNNPIVQILLLVGSPQDPTASPNPIFPDADSAIAYYNDPTGGNAPQLLIDNVNSRIGSTIYTTSTVSQIDPPVAAAFQALENELSLVAFSGSYNDLLSQPSIPTLPINETDVTNLTSDLSGKVDKTNTVNTHPLTAPVTVTKADVGLSNVDNTNDLNKPISTATQTALDAKFNIPSGTSSQYIKGDGTISNFPTIPAAQVNSDWNSSSGLSQILNKPSLATVATSGSYLDLSSKPSIPGAQIQSDWNESNTALLDFIKNKPALSTVATSGNYNDLSNQPTIPNVTRTTSTLSLSLVGTGATGTQIHSTKDSNVKCTVSTSTTSTIGGPATSIVALKICSTNNATEGSWTTVSTFESDQNITLALALQSVQVIKGQICADVPGGWYVKLVNSGTGTHSEAFISGQQTIYG